MFTSSYLGRYLLCNRPSSHDQARLPQRPLHPSPRPVGLALAQPPAALGELRVPARRGAPATPLGRLLRDTGSTAFVVLREGAIVWQDYANGGAAGRADRCFSVTKSIASALVGIAVGDGLVASVDLPIGNWLPELRDARVRELSVAHLLEMRSGIRFVEGLWPWRDEPRSYYATDLRRRLPGCRCDDPVGAYFHYNDWHPQLLSLLLERATGSSVTAWLQTRLWDPLGAEHRASMMVDRDDAAGVEHLESGLTASALDLARFGQLFLQDGVWQGRRLLPQGWVEATTSPAGARTDAQWFAYYRDRPWGRFLSSGRVFYKRMWWGVRLDDRRHDFFAMGVLGQHVYVSPDTGVVIVRLADRFPPGMWWPPVFRAVAEAVAGPVRAPAS